MNLNISHLYEPKTFLFEILSDQMDRIHKVKEKDRKWFGATAGVDLRWFTFRVIIVRIFKFF